MAKHRLPWRPRWHAWQAKHEIIKFNTQITVPSFDLSARGWLIECECGKTWAY